MCVRATSCLLLLAAFLLTAGSARADVELYRGPHPLPDHLGAGMCWIDGDHAHSYEPEDAKVVYVKRGREWVFVGDPVIYEPEEAPRYAYYGHHPVTWVAPAPGQPPHYCYISGPHHHWHAPPAGASFEQQGDVYWFVGPHPPGHAKRVEKHAHVDVYYASSPVVRPVVTVEPPRGYVGFYVAGTWAPTVAVWRGPPGPAVYVPAWHHHGWKVKLKRGRKRHAKRRKFHVKGPKLHVKGPKGPKLHVKGPKVHVKGGKGGFKVKGPGGGVKVKAGRKGVKVKGPGGKFKAGRKGVKFKGRKKR